MFFGTKEIVSQDGNVVTFNDGGKEYSVTVTEKQKQFFTEKPLTGSELQERMAKAVASEFLSLVQADLSKEPEIDVSKFVDVLAAYDVRLVDVSSAYEYVASHLMAVKSAIDATVNEANEKKIVEAVGKEKLDAYSRIFGATADAPSNSVRNVRISDVFH